MLLYIDAAQHLTTARLRYTAVNDTDRDLCGLRKICAIVHRCCTTSDNGRLRSTAVDDLVRDL